MNKNLESKTKRCECPEVFLDVSKRTRCGLTGYNCNIKGQTYRICQNYQFRTSNTFKRYSK